MAKKSKRFKIVAILALSILSIVTIWIGIDYTWVPPPPPIIKNKPHAIKRHPSNEYTWGIDISHHQGEITWGKMIGDQKPDFIFLKATEGNHFTDNRFQSYKKEIQKLGILFSGYHFMRFNQNGKTQALHFLKKTNPKKGELIPVVDIEYQRHFYTDEIAQRNIDLFMETIRSAIGVYPIVYCEEKYFHKYLKKKYEDCIILWIANYRRKPTVPHDLWQKTCKFSHPSFRKKIDFNLLNDERIGMKDLILK
jgi:lysozyme